MPGSESRLCIVARTSSAELAQGGHIDLLLGSIAGTVEKGLKSKESEVKVSADEAMRGGWLASGSLGLLILLYVDHGDCEQAEVWKVMDG